MNRAQKLLVVCATVLAAVAIVIFVALSPPGSIASSRPADESRQVYAAFIALAVLGFVVLGFSWEDWG